MEAITGIPRNALDEELRRFGLGAVVEIANATACELVPVAIDAGVKLQPLCDGNPLQLSVTVEFVGKPEAAAKLRL
jgi:hypothetical protein